MNVMFPRIKCVSVQTGPRTFKSVVTRSPWLRLIWAETQKSAVLGSVQISWLEKKRHYEHRSWWRWHKPKEPWKHYSYVWYFQSQRLVVAYRPKWLGEVAR